MTGFGDDWMKSADKLGSGRSQSLSSGTFICAVNFLPIHFTAVWKTIPCRFYQGRVTCDVSRGCQLPSSSYVYETPSEARITPYQPPYRRFHGHCPAPCCFQNTGLGPRRGGWEASLCEARISHPAPTRPRLSQHDPGVPSLAPPCG